MDLVELEEIRQLKYRYLRCVDLKLWDEIGDVFTEDASADYGTPSAAGRLTSGAGMTSSRSCGTASARDSSRCTRPGSRRSRSTATPRPGRGGSRTR